MDLTVRIGAVRSLHPSHSWPRRLMRAILAAIVTLVASAVLWGSTGALPMLPVAVLATAMFAFPAIRRGTRHITLHAAGVVSRGRESDVVAFEDVDEVWFEFERAGRFASLRGLRLVDLQGASHGISLEVQNAVMLCNAILRACSIPLIAEARSALGRGEPLVFGNVRLTAEDISFRDASIPWENLRIVRILPGRLAFFRKQPVFPWRTVNLDEIPHPTVFLRLVRDRAPHVEFDPLVPDQE